MEETENINQSDVGTLMKYLFNAATNLSAYFVGSITVGSFPDIISLYLFSIFSMRWYGRMKSIIPKRSTLSLSMTRRE